MLVIYKPLTFFGSNNNFFLSYSSIERALSLELTHSPTYLNILEAHSHDKVGRPVGETGHGDGRRPGSLREQLCHDEPGDGPRSDLKEGNKGENGNDAQVRHPLELVLEEQREAGVKKQEPPQL